MAKMNYWVVDYYTNPKEPRVVPAEVHGQKALEWYKEKHYDAIYKNKADAEFRLNYPYDTDPWRKERYYA